MQRAEPIKAERISVMAKPVVADEVQVLRFFEAGSIEKAEVLFNIVSEKMRERLNGRDRDKESCELEPTAELAKKRPPQGNRKAPTTEGQELDHAE